MTTLALAAALSAVLAVARRRGSSSRASIPRRASPAAGTRSASAGVDFLHSLGPSTSALVRSSRPTSPSPTTRPSCSPRRSAAGGRPGPRPDIYLLTGDGRSYVLRSAFTCRRSEGGAPTPTSSVGSYRHRGTAVTNTTSTDPAGWCARFPCATPTPTMRRSGRSASPSARRRRVAGRRRPRRRPFGSAAPLGLHRPRGVLKHLLLVELRAREERPRGGLRGALELRA